VYGLGALAFDNDAVQSIFRAKLRPAEKAIPILLGRAQDLSLVARDVPEMARRLADRFWPGPLTIITNKNSNVPAAVSSTATVAARVPDHGAALALLRAAGPMAVTSANISGQANPSTAGDVLAQLGGRIAMILDGGETPGGIPSTIVNCLHSEPEIVRAGPLSLEALKAALA
jgi:L-threonylcarbamoyladenylate synthase